MGEGEVTEGRGVSCQDGGKWDSDTQRIERERRAANETSKKRSEAWPGKE